MVLTVPNCGGRELRDRLELLHQSFRDLFILVRKNRINSARVLKQQHARKHHCYFLVLKNNKRKDRRVLYKKPQS